MKIAFFCPEFHPQIVGGLGVYANSMAKTLAELGDSIDVYTMNNGSLPAMETIGEATVYRPLAHNLKGGLPHIFSEQWRSWVGGTEFIGNVLLFNVLSANEFLNNMKSGKDYDLVVCHDWLSAISCSVIKESTDIPVIFQLHSTEWGRSQGWPFAPIAELEKRTGEIADAVITVSNPMQEHLINLGFEPEKIRVAWNGVDAKSFDLRGFEPADILGLRKIYGIKPDEKMILFVGRLTSEKGITELVQAMSLARTEKAKLVILGVGYLENAIRSLVGNLGLEDRVLCNFRFLPENERVLHYAACDITAFPSKFEPFGIVSLEAMAMEKPTIVGTCGISGFRDQVVPSGDSQTGCHVNGNNPADIAEWGIDLLCGLPGERLRQFGLNGRRRVEKYFTWEHSALQTKKIYEEVLNRI